MTMIQCASGRHFYHKENYDECPFCEKQVPSSVAGDIKQTSVDEGEKTGMILPGKSLPTGEIVRPVATAPLSPNSPGKAPATHVITSGNKSQQPNRLLPVVGWLVVIDGPGKGADFRLIQGNNAIGRGPNNEVVLDFGERTDVAVSREAHAIIVFDNHSNEFFIERGDSRNLPRVNNSTVRRDSDLAAGDIIQVGETKLLFQPLAGENFQWDD